MLVPASIYGLSYVDTQITTSKLKSVANELPTFNGKNIADGERNNRECYASDTKTYCPTLTIKQPLSEETGWQQAQEFINASKQNGVKWSRTDPSGYVYLRSNTFSRDDRRYNVWIEKSGDEFWVSLVETNY